SKVALRISYSLLGIGVAFKVVTRTRTVNAPPYVSNMPRGKAAASAPWKKWSVPPSELNPGAEEASPKPAFSGHLHHGHHVGAARLVQGHPGEDHHVAALGTEVLLANDLADLIGDLIGVLAARDVDRLDPPLQRHAAHGLRVGAQPQDPRTGPELRHVQGGPTGLGEDDDQRQVELVGSGHRGGGDSGRGVAGAPEGAEVVAPVLERSLGLCEDRKSV